jgi:PAS domain S-box-containing protein
MSVAHQFRDGMKCRINILFQNATFRYLFGIAAVASVFALRIWLIRFTGTGAPLALFFAAVLVTGLFAGVGPGICTVLLSMPLAAYTFVMGAGYSIVQASFQSLLFAVDGIAVVYLTFLTKKKVWSLQNANRQVRESEEKYRALFDSIDEGFCVIEVLFDDAGNAHDYRFLEVNRVFEKQTGISNAVGRRMREIAPALEEHWFQIYGQIARTGDSRRFENPALALGRFYDVYAFRIGRPEQRQVAILFNDITKRKQAEEALRRTQALNEAVLSSLDANIAVLDREGNIIAVNDAWKRFAYENDGAAVADSVGVNYLQVCRDASESGDGGWSALNGIQAVLDGTLHNFVLEYPCHSPGEKRWFLMSVTPLLSERGGAVVSHTDIAVRKRIEEALKAANTFLDAIIENIPLMLFIKESQSLRFIRLNRTGEDFLGWPKETLIGKNDYDFWPKEQAEFFVQKDREALKSGRVVDIPEEPLLTRYRGVRILHTKKVPIPDTTGNPIYLLGISEDITERKRFEKEQQFLAEVSVTLSTSLEYEQTLANLARLVVRNFADWSAVDVMDEQGQLMRLKVASADPSQAALCAVLEQLPPDRDLPHLMRSVIESKRPVVVEQVTLQYIESLGQGPGHLQALLATGVTSFVAVPLLMRGQALGALFLGSSTLSRVIGQDDLRLAEALAERAAIAIENARLYRASVHATQLRDQVLSVVAHDLRNPLSNILMQASVIKRHGREPERRSQKPMEVIERAARRMNRLIQDLLDVALMEAGQLTIERAPLSAEGLIVEAVDMQRPLASSSSLELRIEADPDVADVWGDRDRLLQVFENLIGNAIKFTKAGGRITAGATSRDDEVVFWVADTGSGIPSENLPRVFDRFWQASRAGRQGAGLGLPITKGIVEAHGGRIWVKSTAGRGCTFSFTIPRAFTAQDRLSDRSRPDRVA